MFPYQFFILVIFIKISKKNNVTVSNPNCSFKKIVFLRVVCTPLFTIYLAQDTLNEHPLKKELVFHTRPRLFSNMLPYPKEIVDAADSERNYLDHNRRKKKLTNDSFIMILPIL